MKILGFYGQASSDHDPSAVLMVDGKIVAAVEEERLIREKHAVGKYPIRSIRFCLEEAGLGPEDIDVVAIPWSHTEDKKYALPFFKRTFPINPTKAYKVVKKLDKHADIFYGNIDKILIESGFNPEETEIKWYSHHDAHAASAYYLSGFNEAAVMTLDGAGGFLSGTYSEASGNNVKRVYQTVWPDSLGAFYSTFTEFLGFDPNDGEYKLMGMAPFGSAGNVDFRGIIKKNRHGYRVRNGFFYGNRRHNRYKEEADFSKQMVKRFGEPRKGDGLESKYADIAAAVQEKFEEITIYMMEKYLSKGLKKHGNLCFSGGCALNVTLNRKLIEYPLVKNLWVQPASNDAGLPLGAALMAAVEGGDRIEPMEHVYYGPKFNDQEIEDVLKDSGYKFEKVEDIASRTAELIAKGHIVGWMQGRLEWGPRALGGRSILADPSVIGMKDKVNEIIKFREIWRPFCPSVLEEYMDDIFSSGHDSPFMTHSFDVKDEWKKKVPEIVHIDGSARPQSVKQSTNPLYHDMISKFHDITGIPCVMNTSLNRRGEPMVNSPEDGIKMFTGSGMRFLAMGSFLVTKE